MSVPALGQSRVRQSRAAAISADRARGQNSGLPTPIIGRDTIPIFASRERCVDDPAEVPARAAAAVRRQRLRGADLRSRLVPAPAARHRIVGGVDGRAARHVHGRHVPGQPPAAAVASAAPAASASRLRLPRARHRRCSACWSSSACRSSAASTRAWAGSGVIGILLRGLAAAVCLLPPTLLMGATLPAISRWVESTPEGVSWLGFFYGGNIAGGVLGSLLAGFYLLRVYDMAIATYVAVALNVDCRGAGARDCAIGAGRPTRPSDRDGAAAGAGVRDVGGLRRDRAVGHDRARRGGDLDAAAVAALRRDGLHVLADPRGVPLRPRHRQQPRLGDRAQHRAPARRARLVPDAAVRRDRLGGLHADATRCRTGRSTRRSPPTPGSTSSSISSAASGSCCPARSSGARASRWRSPPSRRAARIRRGWSAASTRPTPSARSSAR